MTSPEAAIVHQKVAVSETTPPKCSMVLSGTKTYSIIEGIGRINPAQKYKSCNRVKDGESDDKFDDDTYDDTVEVKEAVDKEHDVGGDVEIDIVCVFLIFYFFVVARRGGVNVSNLVGKKA